MNSPYAKFFVAVLGALATAVSAAVTDETITSSEWVIILLAGLTAAGVYLYPNRDRAS